MDLEEEAVGLVSLEMLLPLLWMTSMLFISVPV